MILSRRERYIVIGTVAVVGLSPSTAVPRRSSRNASSSMPRCASQREMTAPMASSPIAPRQPQME